MKVLKKNKLHFLSLTTEQELIEHAKKFAKNLRLDNIPISIHNRYYVPCSTIFAKCNEKLQEAKHIISGQAFLSLLKRLDQFENLNLKVGKSVAIVNTQLQGNYVELWGFTTPKIITKITRDPNDDSIKQFEFNNDPNDIWPRTENIEYHGHFLMYSAFFNDKKSADHAVTMLYLQGSEGLDIKNHIRESASGYIPSKKQANDPRFKKAF